MADPTTVPPPVQIEQNVPYGRYAGSDLEGDLYLPTSGRRHAAILLVHGGGWSSGDKSSERGAAEVLAAHGYVVYAIDYTLDSPDRPGFPLQVQECQEALRWMERHAKRAGVDPGRIAVAGGSAGGYLAAMVATVGPGQPGYRPARAAISLSGPLDPAALVAQIRAGLPCRPAGCGVTRTAEQSLEQFLGCSAKTCSARLLEAASPADHVTSESPPFFIYNSAAEIVPVTQARTMATRLEQERVPVEVLVLPGTQHGPPSLADVSQPVLAFLIRYMPPTSAPIAVIAASCVGALGIIGASVWFRGFRRRRSRLP